MTAPWRLALLSGALLACARAQAPEPLDAGAARDLGLEPDGGEPSCTAGQVPPEGGPVVALRRGYVRGRSIGATEAFLGLPYAEAPVGARRWRPPSPGEGCFAAPLDATALGPKCPQLEDETFVGDEDCLQLNVWRPSAAAPARAVMFFIHGGGNALGSTRQLASGVPIYDGASLAERGDVLVVTANYRLGQLGWLAHPAVDDPEGRSGNYGLLDLLEALRWVHANISAFGGDPSRVMIFGESAGAVNTCLLLASPLAQGLFHAALMQSGGCPGYTRAEVQAESEPVVEALGCDQAPDPAACLREAPVERVIRAYPPKIEVAGFSSRLQPHVDGWVLPGPPLAAIGQGAGPEVVLVVGANAEETSRSAPALQTEAQYHAAVRALFLNPAVAELVLAQYPASAFPTPRAAFVRLTTDAKFVCPSRAVLRARVGADLPAYRYVFTHALESGPGRVFGAWHGLELAFLFDVLEVGGYLPSAAERGLARVMQGYWSSLARDGAPSADGAPSWPLYEVSADPYLQLDGEGVALGAGYRAEACDFWDRLSGG